MSTFPLDRYREAIRDVPDFPKPGIVFKDITPLLLNPELLCGVLDAMAEAFSGQDVEKILAIESRGFLFGAGVAERLGVGLALARKPGKLPWQTQRIDYDLEYGTDAIEVHLDAVETGERTLVVDDLLATGGTAAAAGDLIEKMGGEVAGYAFLAELGFLNGRERLGRAKSWSLLSFE